MMRSCLLVAVGLWVGACDYRVPLGEAPEREIDPGVIGLWERTRDDGETERLLVLPMGAREYLVMFPAGTPNALFGRAWLVEQDGDPRWVQLQWLGTGQGRVPEADTPVFQVARYRLDGDALAVRLLNPEVVTGDAATAAELAQAVEANRDHPDLFREEAVLTRAGARRPRTRE